MPDCIGMFMVNIEARTRAEIYVRVDEGPYGGINQKAKYKVMKLLEMLVEKYYREVEIKIIQTDRSLDSSEPDFIVRMVGSQQNIARISDELHQLQYVSITGPY